MTTTKKTASKSKPKSKKSAKPRAAAKTPKVKAAFFSAKRSGRGVPRKAFHVLLNEEQRAKLVKLTFSMKLNAADVVRSLIDKAKA